MRVPSLLAALIALAVAGCDAGSTSGPGTDNAWPGPELTIVQPGPDATVRREAERELRREPDGRVPRDAEGRVPYRVVRWKMPMVLIDVRRPAPGDAKAGDQIAWSLDGGPVALVAIEDARRGFEIDTGAHEPGTHVLQACVVRADGTPYTNPEAAAACVFHLHAESGTFDRFEPESESPLVPRRSGDPALFVTGPHGGTTNPRFGATVNGVARSDLWRITWRLDRKGDWQALAPEGVIAFKDLSSGDHTLDVRLETRAGPSTDWAPVLRPRTGYTVVDGALTPNDAPGAGEIDFQRRTFHVR